MSTSLPPIRSFLPPPSPAAPLFSTPPFPSSTAPPPSSASTAPARSPSDPWLLPTAAPAAGPRSRTAPAPSHKLPPTLAAPAPADRSPEGLLPPMASRGPNGVGSGAGGYLSPTSPLTPASAASSASAGSTSPASAPAAGSPAPAAPGRGNPLAELMDTERSYVQDLSTVIKRIASVFSRQNFPPAHLDVHFRLIEAVYRANKTFLGELLDVGTEPRSPKALGDLLMRWVDDLEPAYGKYAEKWAGGGGWTRDPATQDNAALQTILGDLPWPSALPLPPAELFPGAGHYLPSDVATFGHGGEPHATLTAHFALPYARLGYYKRLYHKLLKSTQPGKTDHRLLVSANDRLAALLEAGKSRSSVLVDGVPPLSEVEPPQAPGTGRPPANVAPLKFEKPLSGASLGLAASGSTSPGPPVSPVHAAAMAAIAAGREKSQGAQESPVGNWKAGSGAVTGQEDAGSVDRGSGSGRGSGSAMGSGSVSSFTEDRSFDTKASTPPLSQPTRSGYLAAAQNGGPEVVPVGPGIVVERRVLDLEYQLDTGRCLDIFTMKPKKCRLQMAPAALTFSRYLRRASDVSFQITPSPPATSDPSAPPPRPIRTPRARLVLITDLLILAAYFTEEDRVGAEPGRELWLLYPPLSGKHLTVEARGEEGFDVWVMRKERVEVTVRGRAERDAWIRALEEAIDFGNNRTPRSNNGAPHSGDLSSGGPPGSHTVPHARPPGPLMNIHRPLPGQQPLTSPPLSSPPAPGQPQYAHWRPPQMGPGGDHGPRGPPSRKSSESGGMVSPRSASGGGGGEPFYSPPPSGSHSFRSAGNSPVVSQHGWHPGAGPEGYFPPPRQGTSSSGDYPEQQQQQHRPPPHLRKTPSSHSLGSASQSSGDPRFANAPPVPNLDTWRSTDTRGHPGSDGFLAAAGSRGGSMHRSKSAEPYRDRHYQMPSALASARSTPAARGAGVPGDPDSPPMSPVGKPAGPTTSTLAATMKTKVFLKQGHHQWKALGTAQLKVFVNSPGNAKQLVVEGDKGKTMISTIVLTDAVERVGRTGLAVDLSDNGVLTGIVYMLQMKTEASATGLFEQLLQGSDRRSGAGR